MKSPLLILTTQEGKEREFLGLQLALYILTSSA